jgi:probable F420-dependent oxidoreductase
MKIGLVYPQTEFPGDPAVIRDYTQTAEELGYSHILAYDHILGASLDHPDSSSMPYTIKHPFMEPITLFAYMAACTNRMEFASGIIILPQRQTALFAKQAAVLDLLCKGRLRLGIAIGWNEVEYTALGEKFNDRGRRIEEQVEVLRLLWTEPLVEYTGRWHTLPNVGLNPLPLQRPIPLWFGGAAEASLSRAARLGDGWMISTHIPSGIERALEIIYSTLEAAGRGKDQFGLEARIAYSKGDPESWISQVEKWRKIGATHLSFNTMNAGLSSVPAQMEAIERFARTIGIAA